MVFFTCGGCGDSLKKNKVKEHTFRCRSCQYVTCMDCNKDFFGDDFNSHTKCISEQEKYGNNVVVVNKGEKKQEAWVDAIQGIIDLPSTSQKVKNVLTRIATYDNIPRKFPKFKNFLRTSLNLSNEQLIEEVWKVIETATKPTIQKPEPQKTIEPSSESTQNGQNKKSDKKQKVDKENQESEEKIIADGAGEVMENGDKKKLSKKERKEKRRQENTKIEKKDKNKNQQDDEEQNGESVAAENGSGKKRKRGEETSAGSKKSSKKAKVREEPIEEPAVVEDEEVAETETVEKLKKFNIDGIVIEILQGLEDHRLPIKKLRKKILSEYSSGRYRNNMTEEQLSAKLTKKLEKNPMFNVHKEKVTLKC